ncbi:MAG TPA: geranylgeranyl reductase family protein [Chryseolinea sp.]|nr:geranylgeranyl reductase family protein [Chryseolinea sp.]
MEKKEFDVLIIGSGPAGAACAIALGNSGLSVAVLDKAVFPRDKICGDALSVDVVNQLSLLQGDLTSRFQGLDSKVSSYGVRIFAPNHQYVDIPFIHKGEEKCGYLCPRFDFDQLLVEQLSQYENVKMFEDCAVERIDKTETEVLVHTNKGTFSAKMIAGADGAQSVVARQLGSFKPDREHYSAGLRVYYEGITAFQESHFIELHFFKDVLPGYLWIFPLPNNRANVGVGILSSVVSKKRINLKTVLKSLIENNPHLNERFQGARPLEVAKGYGLPLGSKKRKISGDRFLLLGDAASLIDPFTGEGIGNAIRSGRVAADHIVGAFKSNDFSRTFNIAYDHEIYRRMWPELKVSRGLQNLCRYPRLFNSVVRKANKSTYIHDVLVGALAQSHKKRSLLLHPSFYYHLLFK